MAYKTYSKKPWQFLSLTWTYLSLEAYRPHWCLGAESAGISFFIKDEEFFCLFSFSLTVWQSHSLYSIWLLLMCLNKLLLWIASKISVYISPIIFCICNFFSDSDMFSFTLQRDNSYMIIASKTSFSDLSIPLWPVKFLKY